MTAAEGPSADPLPRVFVNCSFDASFREQLHAIVFTCVHAGFFPVRADSGGQTGRPRLERIFSALDSCRYSIHDLTFCRGEGDENLARFNMPLELGMAMALRARPGDAPVHEYLILVPAEQHLYKRYVSDLGGLDPQTHDGSAKRIVAEVLAWLLTAAEAPADLSPSEVIEKLPAFETGLEALRQEWQEGSMPWPRVVKLAARVARSS